MLELLLSFIFSAQKFGLFLCGDNAFELRLELRIRLLQKCDLFGVLLLFGLAKFCISALGLVGLNTHVANRGCNLALFFFQLKNALLKLFLAFLGLKRLPHPKSNRTAVQSLVSLVSHVDLIADTKQK